MDGTSGERPAKSAPAPVAAAGGDFATLAHYLDGWAGDDGDRAAVAAVVQAIAGTAARISEIIARGSLEGQMGAVVGDNTDGDAQKALDVRSDEMFISALRGGPVALYGSEEQEHPVTLNPEGTLAVAIDPLDGSSNIDTNVSIGTIFSILPSAGLPAEPAEAIFLQPGTRQVGAGFVIYGPQTALVLTVMSGTQIFTYSREKGAFLRTGADVLIVTGKREYAINASNYNHWDEPLRAYIDDCLEGLDSPDRQQFNMRWIASLVAEAYRIMARGGIFLYPRDKRPGYQHGRLRLVYEANPIALLVEQAGGAAVDAEHRILEIVPQRLHERVPLIFGDREKVERVVRYHTGRHTISERQPLFGRRGLFRE
jgi:fructose-1,6-bisphosphatase I